MSVDRNIGKNCGTTYTNISSRVDTRLLHIASVKEYKVSIHAVSCNALGCDRCNDIIQYTLDGDALCVLNY